MRCPLPLRLVLAAAVLAAALGVGVPGQAAESVEPNREQLQLQIDIMQDYIKKLESNTTKQGEAVDPGVGRGPEIGAAPRVSILA